jgi:Na+-transporting methylmalonyl-CoA/oxaloacetate decarboxylase gamma subunit
MVILILIIVMYVMFYIGEEIRRYYPHSYVGRWWRDNICDDDPN